MGKQEILDKLLAERRVEKQTRAPKLKAVPTKKPQAKIEPKAVTPPKAKPPKSAPKPVGRPKAPQPKKAEPSWLVRSTANDCLTDAMRGVQWLAGRCLLLDILRTYNNRAKRRNLPELTEKQLQVRLRAIGAHIPRRCGTVAGRFGRVAELTDEARTWMARVWERR